MGQVRLDRESPVANNQPNGHARGAKRKMKMPHVINPGSKDWIAAYASMTIYFHILDHFYTICKEVRIRPYL